MRRDDPIGSSPLLALLVVMAPAAVQAAPLEVTQVTPPRNSLAEPTTAVIIDFDRALHPSSVDSSSVRVFGRATGAKQGTRVLSNGNQRLTFQPMEPFSAGETVGINLSHDLAAADLTPLRSAGYFFQFHIRTVPSGVFQPIDTLSNRIQGAQTRIYGAAATDLNHDRYLDLATVNQVSADVRVCLNRADGTGLYQPFLTPVTIGANSSPNDRADFNGDGNTDLCLSARGDNRVWVLLGAGDGTFPTTQSIPVGNSPRGIASLDVDGDGDADIVNTNHGDNSLSLLVNDGSGVFGAASFFDGGVSGEYSLAAADMNNDGIGDLVVGGNALGEIRVLLGNGNGTFTPAGPAQPCGGAVWVVAVDDVNADGNLDASVANSYSNNSAILLGNGAGAFGAPTIIPLGTHGTSTDLGDLDGDGDADLVVSSFFGGFWRDYRNDGTGTFTFHQDFTAPDNPSCAVLYDSDNDGDLDMALTDEIADVILLMRNAGAVGVDPPRPSGTPAALSLSMASGNPARSQVRLRYALPWASQARLAVYDVAGREVRVVEAGDRLAGPHAATWDGRDASGRPAGSGVYLVRLTANGSSVGVRCVLLH